MTSSEGSRRLFLGVELPVGIRSEVGKRARQLEAAGIKAGNWSRADMYHITVLFLGQVESESSAALCEAWRLLARELPPFTITLAGTGGFRRSRVLWVGVGDDAGRSALRALHEMARQATNRIAPHLAVSLDTRAFAPHITIARKLGLDTVPRRDGSRDAFELDSQGGDGASWTVTELCLFESSRRDGRLCYPVVDRFAFRSV